MDVWPACDDPRREPHPPLEANELEKEGDPDARRQRGAPVAGKDREQRADHPARRLFGEKEIAELRRIEPEDEPAERAVALALAPREAAEPPGRQVSGRKTISYRLRRLEPRLERDGDARRKHRIEKRPGIAREHPAVTRVRARPEGEVLLDAYRPPPVRRR